MRYQYSRQVGKYIEKHQTEPVGFVIYYFYFQFFLLKRSALSSSNIGFNYSYFSAFRLYPITKTGVRSLRSATALAFQQSGGSLNLAFSLLLRRMKQRRAIFIWSLSFTQKQYYSWSCLFLYFHKTTSSIWNYLRRASGSVMSRKSCNQRAFFLPVRSGRLTISNISATISIFSFSFFFSSPLQVDLPKCRTGLLLSISSSTYLQNYLSCVKEMLWRIRPVLDEHLRLNFQQRISTSPYYFGRRLLRVSRFSFLSQISSDLNLYGVGGGACLVVFFDLSLFSFFSYWYGSEQGPLWKQQILGPKKIISRYSYSERFLLFHTRSIFTLVTYVQSMRLLLPFLRRCFRGFLKTGTKEIEIYLRMSTSMSLLTNYSKYSVSLVFTSSCLSKGILTPFGSTSLFLATQSKKMTPPWPTISSRIASLIQLSQIYMSLAQLISRNGVVLTSEFLIFCSLQKKGQQPKQLRSNSTYYSIPFIYSL